MGQALGIVTAIAQLGLESISIKPTRFMGPFTAQVVIEEQHVDELEITDHPVETGARVTDHAYLRPAEVTIRCTWSNSPNDTGSGGVGGFLSGIVGGAIGGTLSGVSGIINGIGSKLGNLPGVSNLTGSATSMLKSIPGLSVSSPGADTPAKIVYSNLLMLQRVRIPMYVSTGKRLYANMLVKSLRVTTNKESENMLDMTATFRQVLIVSTRVVSVSAPAAAQKTPSATASILDKGTKALGATSFPVADQANLIASTLPALPNVKKLLP